MAYFPPGLPGYPGPGLPATRDSTQPFGGGSFDVAGSPFGVTSCVIVNRTLFHSYSITTGSVAIPPTTAGNTLVVVQMGIWDDSFPSFNGIEAGYPSDYQLPATGELYPSNDQGSGFSGRSNAFPIGYNTGSAIAYWTNIPGGLTEVAYTFGNGIPTFGIVYELIPSIVTDIFGTADQDFVAFPPPNPPAILAPPINGASGVQQATFTWQGTDTTPNTGVTSISLLPSGAAAGAGGFYICTVQYTDFPTIGGSFIAVNSPWVFDYQETLLDWSVNNAFGAGAVAIIDDYCGSGSTGSTGTPGELDQFLPNVWIVS